MNSLLEKEIYKKFTFKNAVNSQGATDAHDKMNLMVFLIMLALQLEFSTADFVFKVYYNEASVSEYKRSEKFMKRLLEQFEFGIAEAVYINLDVSFAIMVCIGVFFNRWILRLFRRNHIIVFSIGFICCLRLAYSVVELYYHRLSLILLNIILIGLIISNLISTFMEIFPDEIIVRSLVANLFYSKIVVEITLEPFFGFGLNQIKVVSTIKMFLLLSFIYFTIVFMLSFMLLLESPHYLISINKKTEAIAVLNNLIWPTKLNMTEVYFTISNMESEIQVKNAPITITNIIGSLVMKHNTTESNLKSIRLNYDFKCLAILSFPYLFCHYQLQSGLATEVESFINSTLVLIVVNCLISMITSKFDSVIHKLRAPHLLCFFALILSIFPNSLPVAIKSIYFITLLFLKRNFLLELIKKMVKLMYKVYTLNSTKLSIAYSSKLHLAEEITCLLLILSALTKTITNKVFSKFNFDI